MASIANQYKALNEGKINVNEFMNTVREQVPHLVTNVMSLDDVVSVLRNKQIIESSNEPVIEKFDFKSSLQKMTEAAKQKIKGGKGDKLNPDDVNYHEFQKGWKHELEHTDDVDKAKEIALDHLAEDPMYYTHLEMVEYMADKKKRKDLPLEVKKDQMKDPHNQMEKVKKVSTTRSGKLETEKIEEPKKNVGNKKERPKKVKVKQMKSSGDQKMKTIKEAMSVSKSGQLEDHSDFDPENAIKNINSEGSYKFKVRGKFIELQYLGGDEYQITDKKGEKSKYKYPSVKSFVKAVESSLDRALKNNPMHEEYPYDDSDQTADTKASTRSILKSRKDANYYIVSSKTQKVLDTADTDAEAASKILDLSKEHPGDQLLKLSKEKLKKAVMEYKKKINESVKAKDLKKDNKYIYTGGAENMEVVYIGTKQENPEIKVGSSLGGGGYIFQYGTISGKYINLGPTAVMKYIEPVSDNLDEQEFEKGEIDMDNLSSTSGIKKGKFEFKPGSKHKINLVAGGRKIERNIDNLTQDMFDKAKTDKMTVSIVPVTTSAPSTSEPSTSITPSFEPKASTSIEEPKKSKTKDVKKPPIKSPGATKLVTIMVPDTSKGQKKGDKFNFTDKQIEDHINKMGPDSLDIYKPGKLTKVVTTTRVPEPEKKSSSKATSSASTKDEPAGRKIPGANVFGEPHRGGSEFVPYNLGIKKASIQQSITPTTGKWQVVNIKTSETITAFNDRQKAKEFIQKQPNSSDFLDMPAMKVKAAGGELKKAAELRESDIKKIEEKIQEILVKKLQEYNVYQSMEGPKVQKRELERLLQGFQWPDSENDYQKLNKQESLHKIKELVDALGDEGVRLFNSYAPEGMGWDKVDDLKENHVSTDEEKIDFILGTKGFTGTKEELKKLDSDKLEKAYKNAEKFRKQKGQSFRKDVDMGKAFDKMKK